MGYRLTLKERGYFKNEKNGLCPSPPHLTRSEIGWFFSETKYFEKIWIFSKEKSKLFVCSLYSRCSFSMMVKWANDDLLQANDGKMLVTMVKCSLMMVKCSSMMVKWLYDHTLISPSLTTISPSLTSILPSLAWSIPSFALWMQFCITNWISMWNKVLFLPPFLQ